MTKIFFVLLLCVLKDGLKVVFYQKLKRLILKTNYAQLNRGSVERVNLST